MANVQTWPLLQHARASAESFVATPRRGQFARVHGIQRLRANLMVSVTATRRRRTANAQVVSGARMVVAPTAALVARVAMGAVEALRQEIKCKRRWISTTSTAKPMEPVR